jgi:hypothetical protein
MPGNALSREEFIALGEIAKARRRLLVNMFAGTNLKFNKTSALASGKKLVSSGKKVRSGVTKLSPGASKLGSGAGKLGSGVSNLGSGAGKVVTAATSEIEKVVRDFIVQCADVENLEEIISVITTETMSELITEVTPFVGVVASGAKMGKAAKAVATDGYNLYKSSDYKKGFLRGDPVAAAEAVQTIIKRDLAKQSVKLAQQAAATGTKIAGLFADLGTATTVGVGLANTLATLGLELFSLGVDIKEMRAGNQRLAKPDTLDLTVFEECPILGCYLITCADTSLVANFFVADIGLPGWMDKVEKLKKTQMDPMLKLATKDIQSSRLQLENLSTNKGTHADKGFFSKIKSKATRLVAAI